MKSRELLERARGVPTRTLLAGGDSARLSAAAARLTEAGIEGITVIGDGGVSPNGHPQLEAVARLLRTREPDRVRDGIHALDLAVDPLRFALGLAALGNADAVVAGPGVTAPALADAARWALGPPRDGAAVRSVSWLHLDNGRLVAFADCSLADELPPLERARIARAAAEAHTRVAAEIPSIAFLAGPPGRNGDGALEAAVAGLRTIAPALTARAAPGGEFPVSANVLIFPGGTAAHLAIRSSRAMAGARLLGPLLLGLSGTVAGVADDADVEEVVGTAAAVVLAAGPAGT